MAAVVVAAVVVAAVLVVRSFGTDTHGAHVVRFTINSPLVHESLPVAAVVPPGKSAGPRPLLVFLHGKGEDENSYLDDAMFAALARLGPRAPDVAFPYGGADSYWHNRKGGAWGSYVMKEVIGDAVKRLGADPKRVAIGGISMGGFGARPRPAKPAWLLRGRGTLARAVGERRPERRRRVRRREGLRAERRDRDRPAR